MSQDQITLLVILVVTVGMFLWGRWRHDMVAAGALLACVVFGLVAPGEAFLGFGHPAVITVACVLVLSRGLQTSGAVEALTRLVLPSQAGVLLSLAALVGLGAVLSSVMNNVGAMALLMPVAVQTARRLEMPPGQVLMPLAFGTILGGMTTMIGTPPNLIVSGFRAEHGSAAFGMFDYTPVGLAVALSGVVFIMLVGRFLVPVRKQSGIEGFESGAYLTEARVQEDSKAVGLSLREVEQQIDETGAQVVGLVHNEVRLTAPNPRRKVRAGDILIIEAETDELATVLSSLKLKLEEEKEAEKDAENEAAQKQDPKPAKRRAEEDGDEDDEPEEEDTADSSGDIVLMELAVMPTSGLSGRSASDLSLRTRYGINLLAISRHGQRSLGRLRTMAMRRGDLLLMQGPPEAISEFASDHGCVPLAARDLLIPDRRKAWAAGLIMLLAIGTAALGVLPVAVSFAVGVLASMAMRTVPPRSVYDAIDWPVIVLLGALIPVAGAMESSGAADLIARVLIENFAQDHAVISLILILVVTMFLSDLMNNAATAAVMCPIAIGTATALGVSVDTFLMAVAIGASCAFLTPIGHQNNTLILGPGGFRFSDFWKLGLPLEFIVVAVSIPLLLLIWPL